MIKFPANYEGYDPAEVGLSRHMVIGKHSGSHGLKERLARLGLELPAEELNGFLAQVRAYSQQRKTALSDHDLLRLFGARRQVA